MATLTKVDMIKELIAEGKAEEFRGEKDSDASLAKKLYRLLLTERVAELYAERIKSSPEEALETITKKAEKVAEPKKKEVKKTATKTTKKVKVEETPDVENYDPLNVPEAKIRIKKGDKEVIEIHPLYKPKAIGKIVIPKVWIYEELKLAGFEGIETGHAKRKCARAGSTLMYNVETNKLEEVRNGSVVASTICLCQFMVHGFIKKRI
jgi:HD superfamily phosphohydrolase